jgi:hypothetical protein
MVLPGDAREQLGGNDCAEEIWEGGEGEVIVVRYAANADYPVGTVVISGDGAGDQTVGSPELKALDGRIYSGQLRVAKTEADRSEEPFDPSFLVSSRTLN